MCANVLIIGAPYLAKSSLFGHVENADHFLMKCQNYQAQRVELIRAVSQHTSVTLQILLFRNDSLPININIEIYEALQTYIVNTKRFFKYNTYHIAVYTYNTTCD